jgi:hypothetical protein
MYTWHVSPLGETQYDTYAANRTYNMCMLVLDICTWSRGDILGLELIDGDVGLLRGWIVIS